MRRYTPNELKLQKFLFRELLLTYIGFRRNFPDLAVNPDDFSRLLTRFEAREVFEFMSKKHSSHEEGLATTEQRCRTLERRLD